MYLSIQVNPDHRFIGRPGLDIDILSSAPAGRISHPRDKHWLSLMVASGAGGVGMRWVLARSCDQNTGVVGSNNIVLLPTLDAQELTLRSMQYPVGTET